MCEECHEERDEDYDGSSIEAKRQKAIRSIIEWHPELGLETEDVTFRFTPNRVHMCVQHEMSPVGTRTASCYDNIPDLIDHRVMSFSSQRLDEERTHRRDIPVRRRLDR